MKTPRINITAAVIIFLSTISINANAQSGSDKLDVKALEQKYWAAKDDDFSVVQNRAFSKNNRFFTTLHYGQAINDPYYTGSYLGASLGYFFNETWGLEANYMMSNFSDSKSFKDIVSLGGGPKVNEAKDKAVINVMWFPIYAKMSLFDKKIIHFDMGLSLGVGNFGYERKYYVGTFPAGSEKSEKGTSLGYSLGITQQFYFNRLMAIKVDFVNTVSSQKQINYKSRTDEGNKSVNDTSLVIGLSIFQWWGDHAK
jgi:outer membrane beta-barrel protein